jgi:hypothetical protein
MTEKLDARLRVKVLTPLSTIFQLYRGGQLYWWRKLEYPEKTTWSVLLVEETGGPGENHRPVASH